MIRWAHNVPEKNSVWTGPLQNGFYQVACHEPEPEPVVLENLVADPSFDTGDGWQFYTDEGNPEGAIEYGEARITGTSMTDRGRWFTGRNLPVGAGENYILHATIRGDFTEGEPYVCVVFWDTDKQYLGSAHAQPYLTKSGPTIGVRTDAVPPEGSKFARVEFRAWGINGSVWADDIHFGLKPEGPTLEERLLELEAMAQIVMLNPAAALQKQIEADGFWVTSNEFDEDPVVAQRAEHPESGAVRVYYASVGNWDDIQYVERGERS